MSFAAIQRTLEFCVLSASNDSVDDFQNHTRAYNRAAALGVFWDGVLVRSTQVVRPELWNPDRHAFDGGLSSGSSTEHEH